MLRNKKAASEDILTDNSEAATKPSQNELTRTVNNTMYRTVGQKIFQLRSLEVRA